jgi:hypothetical protein
VEDVLPPVRLVGDPGEVAVAPGDLHLIRPEPGLHPERATGPALAREAVADGDGERLALDFETKLSAMTCRLPGGHRPKG